MKKARYSLYSMNGWKYDNAFTYKEALEKCKNYFNIFGKELIMYDNIEKMSLHWNM